MVLTEFHIILLYKGRIAGVCSLDEKLTYEESLPLVSPFVMPEENGIERQLRKPMKKFWG
jgi:Pep3/Vps18/deep orange family